MRGRANEAQSSGTQRARWRGQASAATRRAAERGGEARRGGPLGAQRRKVAKSSAQPSTSETSRPSAPERDAQPSSASRRSSATPQTSLRLCASARDKRRRDDHHPLEEPIADTPEQVAQSRRAAERSPQARALGASRPSERDDDRRRHRNLLAAWRLGARKTTPRRPPPARRADRRHTRTGRAEPQSRRALTSSAIVGDIPLRLRGSFPHASKQRFQALTPPTFSAPPTPPPTSPCPAAPRRPLGTGAGSRPPRSLRRGVAPSPRGEAPDRARRAPPHAQALPSGSRG